MEEFEVFTISGTGESGNKDGPGNVVSFKDPHGIAINNDGTIIVADTSNHKIRGIDLDGNVYTIAGTGEMGDKDGPGNEATFIYPFGIAIRNDGIIVYVSGNKIRGIDLNGDVFTIAGTGEYGDKDGHGNEATFHYPEGIAIMNDGTIIVADTYNHKIRGIDLDGNVFTIAGTGEYGDKDGPGNEAAIDYPRGIAIRDDGTIIIADSGNHKIKGIDLDGNVFTIAGTGELGDKDGPGDEATFNNPYGIAIRDDGTIIVTDTYNHKIRGIDPDGNVYTIAGKGVSGDKDGPGNEATFYYPCGIAIRVDGTIIVSDMRNNKIKGIRTEKLVKSAIE